jgi:hypothetical protein
MNDEAAGAGAFALPAAFWSRFHAEHWERRGGVLRAPLPAPLLTPAQVFRALVAAGDRYRAGDRGVAPELCIEHARLLADVGAHLPAAADGSLQGWATRVARLTEGRRFGLVVDQFEGCDEPLWWRLREFLHGLYAFTGVPGEYVKAALFLGNYGTTPFGLHRGRSSNFMFVVEGKKRIRAWPDEFFRGKEDLTNRLDYQRYLAESIVLDAEPGDVIYWPSSYWHIGEDVGGWSVAVSVALFMDRPPVTDLALQAAQLVEVVAPSRGRRPVRFPAGGPARGTRRVPALVRDTARAFRRAGRRPLLEVALTRHWLDHLTGYGFPRTPAPRPARRLDDAERLRGDARHPVLWLAAGNGDLVCSANGHSFAVTAHPAVETLLRRVNTGRPFQVGEAVARTARTVDGPAHRGRSSAPQVRALLERLWSLRALIDCA